MVTWLALVFHLVATSSVIPDPNSIHWLQGWFSLAPARDPSACRLRTIKDSCERAVRAMAAGTSGIARALVIARIALQSGSALTAGMGVSAGTRYCWMAVTPITVRDCRQRAACLQNTRRLNTIELANSSDRVSNASPVEIPSRAVAVVAFCSRG